MSPSPAGGDELRIPGDWGAVLRAPESTHPIEPAGTKAHGFDPAQVDTIMAGIYARGDRLMLRCLGAHFGIAMLLAIHFNTWRTALLVGTLAIAAFILSVRLLPRRFFTRCVAGLALQTFVALHIYQLHGLAEMHFFFFTGFTMMLVYQDGLSMWPGCIAIILQHILFAYFHNQGVPLHFFEVPHITVTRLFYHFGIAIVQVAICGGWAHLLRQQTLRDAWQKTRLREAGVVATGQLAAIQASEGALRDAWERQRAILDNIPDLAWVHDLQGRFLAVNHSFAKAVGRPVEEVIGSTTAEIFGVDAAVRYRAESERVVTYGVQRQVEEPLIDGRGNRREMETIRGPVFDGQGQIVGTIAIARDITDRKKAERERRDLETKMQEAQKLESLGVLAGGIAHDFNNLLVGVLGNASLAREDVRDGSRVAPLLDEIQTAARRAADLTRQMLAYAGRGQIATVTIDLPSVVQEMLQLLRSAISKRAELEIELESGLPTVTGDATQVRQVVMNLITNASEALLDHPGTIRIRTRSVAGADWRESGVIGDRPDPAETYVALEVTDSGVGMDPATIGRIFEPFFTTKFTGRGLGLSAVQGIVRSHGGVLRVESVPNRGTTFEILWPVAAAAVAADLDVPGQLATDGAQRRILIVDDEAAVRRTAARILERAGYHVEQAASGEEGLSLVRGSVTPFDLVVVDLTMPGISGVETLTAIREIQPEIRGVLVSGFPDSELPVTLRGGSTPFLHKPYVHSELTETVARALLAGTSAAAAPIAT